MPRDEMLSRMSARELTEWQAYEKVSGPLGAERLDVLATMVAYYVVKALGAKKAQIKTMMPDWDRRPQDPKKMAAFLEAFTVAVGGEIVND